MRTAGRERTGSPLRARLHTVKRNWQRAADKVVVCRPSRSLDRDSLHRCESHLFPVKYLRIFNQGNISVRLATRPTISLTEIRAASITWCKCLESSPLRHLGRAC